jgi:hypothetical protein
VLAYRKKSFVLALLLKFPRLVLNTYVLEVAVAAWIGTYVFPMMVLLRSMLANESAGTFTIAIAPFLSIFSRLVKSRSLRSVCW